MSCWKARLASSEATTALGQPGRASRSQLRGVPLLFCQGVTREPEDALSAVAHGSSGQTVPMTETVHLRGGFVVSRLARGHREDNSATGRLAASRPTCLASRRPATHVGERRLADYDPGRTALLLVLLGLSEVAIAQRRRDANRQDIYAEGVRVNEALL